MGKALPKHSGTAIKRLGLILVSLLLFFLVLCPEPSQADDDSPEGTCRRILRMIAVTERENREVLTVLNSENEAMAIVAVLETDGDSQSVLQGIGIEYSPLSTFRTPLWELFLLGNWAEKPISDIPDVYAALIDSVALRFKHHLQENHKEQGELILTVGYDQTTAIIDLIRNGFFLRPPSSQIPSRFLEGDFGMRPSLAFYRPIRSDASSPKIPNSVRHLTHIEHASAIRASKQGLIRVPSNEIAGRNRAPIPAEPKFKLDEKLLRSLVSQLQMEWLDVGKLYLSDAPNIATALFDFLTKNDKVRDLVRGEQLTYEQYCLVIKGWMLQYRYPVITPSRREFEKMVLRNRDGWRGSSD